MSAPSHTCDQSAFVGEAGRRRLQPVTGVGLHAALIRFVEQAGMAAMDRAQRMDRVGQVAGMRRRRQQVQEMRVRRAALLRHQPSNPVPGTLMSCQLYAFQCGSSRLLPDGFGPAGRDHMGQYAIPNRIETW